MSKAAVFVQFLPRGCLTTFGSNYGIMYLGFAESKSYLDLLYCTVEAYFLDVEATYELLSIKDVFLCFYKFSLMLTIIHRKIKPSS